MSDLVVEIDSGNGARRVSLAAYLDADAVEAAEREANRWIKGLREARIDGQTLRDYLTYRGDSLWWFVELYLHKNRAIADLHRTLLAFETLIRRERPLKIVVRGADPIACVVAPQIAKQAGITYEGPRHARWAEWRARAAITVKSALHMGTALIAGLRRGGVRPETEHTGRLAVFIHTAFWRDADEAEGYIGPILTELTKRLPPGAMTCVGVGPRTTYRGRDWKRRWSELRDAAPRAEAFTPIEEFTGWRTAGPSLGVWRRRGTTARALAESADVRQASIIRHCDCWRIIRLELQGVAALQLPWSARAIDEAGAVLDCTRPAAVVTYAEAGGWGRAIVLAARRRGIRSVGLQHGFIYRHWLNYLHEEDEMRPSPANPADVGFPAPAATLVYDELTRQHLVGAGRLRADAVSVTGSARLDALVAATARLTSADLEAVRRDAGATGEQQIVVVAAKFTQIERTLQPLVYAVAALPQVQLVVKRHPADAADAYDRFVRGAPNVVVLPAGSDLARLMAVSRLLVTVNSTSAIEAMVLDVPALVLDLPNNLSPFVEAGAMAGVREAREIGPALRRVLYDEDYRVQLARHRHAFLTQYGIGSDGRAAARAAEHIVQLMS
jgi:hypothetical protein